MVEIMEEGAMLEVVCLGRIGGDMGMIGGVVVDIRMGGMGLERRRGEVVGLEA